VTASVQGATLVTRNASDFAGIPDLDLDIVGSPTRWSRR
jgi:predicted nucleic acid-binding protein